MSNSIKRGLVLVGVLVSSIAQAAIDVSGVTSAITDAVTAIGVVGAAVLIMFVAGKAFKWIRAAL